MKLAMPEGTLNSYGDDKLYLMTMGCTTEGELYGIGSDGNLYDLGSYADLAGNMGEVVHARLVGATGGYPVMIQSMAYDHNTDTMYWIYGRGTAQNYHSNLMTVNLETGAATDLGEANIQISSLFIPYEHNGSSGGAVAVSEINIKESDQNMVLGAEMDLTVQVIPWNANRNLRWESSDESVATVDAKGHVKTVGAGTTTITATAVTNPDISDSISIHVMDLDRTFGGYGAFIQYDSEGWPTMLYDWQAGHASEFTAPATGNSTAEVIVGTMLGDKLCGFQFESETDYSKTFKFTYYDPETHAVQSSNSIELYGLTTNTIHDMASSPELFGSSNIVVASTGTTLMLLNLDSKMQLGGTPVAAYMKKGSTALVGLAFDNEKNLYCLDDLGNLYKATYNDRGSLQTFDFVGETSTGKTNMGSSASPLHSSMCYDDTTGMLYFAQAQSLGVSRAGVIFHAVDPASGNTFEVGKTSAIMDFACLYLPENKD